MRCSSSRLRAVSTTVTEDLVIERDCAEHSHVLAWIGLLAVLSAVVGGLAAVFWSAVVRLPNYRVMEDGLATMTERGLTEVVAADAWFVVTGALVGAGLGLVTWKWFRPLGWPTGLLAAGAGLLAGIVCWRIGQLLGPGDFAHRLAEANPGDLVPISLELRSLSALALWGFAAVTPVLLVSSLGPDEEDGGWRRRREAPGQVPENGTVDERGVLTTRDDSNG